MKPVVFGYGLMGRELRKITDWDNVSWNVNKMDITKPDTYEKYLSDYDTIINCTGYTDTWRAYREPSWTVNYVAIIDLVDLCNKYGRKLVQLSTDYIYTDSKPNAKEDDIPIHFHNWYTYTKLLADGYIQAKCKKYLLIRTSYKPRPFPWDMAWTNLRGNFDYVDVIADLMVRLINKDAEGVYNVGTEAKTMYELALKTKPNCVMMDNSFKPNDVTMNIEKMLKKLND